jgi:hypothetical protein
MVYDHRLRFTISIKLEIHLALGTVTGINVNGRLSELLFAYYHRGLYYRAFGTCATTSLLSVSFSEQTF